MLKRYFAFLIRATFDAVPDLKKTLYRKSSIWDLASRIVQIDVVQIRKHQVLRGALNTRRSGLCNMS